MKKIKVFTSTYIQGKRLKRLFKHILNDLSILVHRKKYVKVGMGVSIQHLFKWLQGDWNG